MFCRVFIALLVATLLSSPVLADNPGNAQWQGKPFTSGNAVRFYNSGLGTVLQDAGNFASGADARLAPWNAKEDGTTDDTAAWTALDAAACSDPTLRRVWVYGMSAIKNLNLSCLTTIEGFSRNSSGFVGTASLTIGDILFRYEGLGPLELNRLSFTCPIYNPASLAQPAGLYAVLVQPQSAATQVQDIRITNVRVQGCNNGLWIEQTRGLTIEDALLDRTWGVGINVDDNTAGPGVNVRNSFVRNNTCLMSGSYCISYTTGSNIVTNGSPAITEIAGNVAIGAGWIAQKYGFDNVGIGSENIVFNNSAYNAFSGGAEFKRVAPSSITLGVVPQARTNDVAVMRYASSIDQGGGADLPFETGTDVGPGLKRALKLEVFATYVQPSAWQATTAYSTGDVRYSTDGNVYQAQASGISGLTAPNGGAGCGPLSNGNGCTFDGTVPWAYRQALPSRQGLYALSASAGATGAGYALTDELTIACAGGESAVVAPSVIDNGGEITALRVIYEGSCPTPPANPLTLSGGSGTGATATGTWQWEPNNIRAGTIEAGTYIEARYHAGLLAQGVVLFPRGSNNQTIDKADVYIDGTFEKECLLDSVFGTSVGTQSGFVNDLKFHPEGCRSLAHQTGAVQLLNTATIPAWAGSHTYFQNNLVSNDGGKTYVAQCDVQAHPAGCASASSGGPTGTSNGISDGASGLSWNYSLQTVASLTYHNLQIIGGVIENKGARNAFATIGTAGSIVGSIDGTSFRGGAGGLLITAPVTMTVRGGGISVTRAAAGINAAPITLSGAGATGTLTMLGEVSATTNAATDGVNNEGVVISGGATGAVNGPLVRGVIASDPSGAYACAKNDVYYITTPTATGPVPRGWVCTTPGLPAVPTVFTPW